MDVIVFRKKEMQEAKKWMEKVEPINALTFLLRFLVEDNIVGCFTQYFD